jgi:hypothetical protein
MSPFHDWKTRKWICKPEGISKQADKIGVRGGQKTCRRMPELRGGC